MLTCPECPVVSVQLPVFRSRVMTFPVWVSVEVTYRDCGAGAGAGGDVEY